MKLINKTAQCSYRNNNNKKKNLIEMVDAQREEGTRAIWLRKWPLASALGLRSGLSAPAPQPPDGSRILWPATAAHSLLFVCAEMFSVG